MLAPSSDSGVRIITWENAILQAKWLDGAPRARHGKVVVSDQLVPTSIAVDPSGVRAFYPNALAHPRWLPWAAGVEAAPDDVLEKHALDEGECSLISPDLNRLIHTKTRFIN